MAETAHELAARLGVSVLAAENYLADKVRIAGDHISAAAIGGALVRDASSRVIKKGRTERVLTFRDQRRTLSQWAAITGIDKNTIRSRLSDGWAVEQALTIPVEGKLGRRRRHAST